MGEYTEYWREEVLPSAKDEPWRALAERFADKDSTLANELVHIVSRLYAAPQWLEVRHFEWEGRRVYEVVAGSISGDPNERQGQLLFVSKLADAVDRLGAQVMPD